MNALIEKFKNKLKNGEHVLGPFMKTGDPAFVEAVGFSGFDFVILDREHGPGSIENLQNLIRGAQCSGVLPIVRVPDINENEISKVLDIGALGIQAPKVTSAKEVEEIIKASRFAPKGERGVCRFVRAAKYSAFDRYKYFKEADDNIIIIQLEGTEAINNIDEILNVEGIDIVFIGPYDLSQSLGMPGNIDHPKVEEKMLQIVEQAKNRGIYVGTFVDTVENAIKWKSRGVQYLSYSVDVGMFYEHCSNIVKAVLG